MAILNDSQKLSWVSPNQPFGTGADGAYSSATIPTLTKDSCSGTSGNATLTTTGSTFANGDVLLLHQTRGTSVGVWEIAKVLSGGGTTSLTLTKNKVNTYTDSGASQAQAVKILQYTNVTVQSGTWTVPSWDGNVGGIFPIAVKNTLTVTGTITANGGNSSSYSSDGVRAGRGTGGGYYGGNALCVTGVGTAYSNQGEGTVGAGTYTTTANGTGGGGSGNGGNGGGGGNGTAGGGSDGAGGGISGSADLTNITPGGGGGGGIKPYSYTVGGGASGGGIVMLFVKSMVITGAISCNGGASASVGNYGKTGGGGAGGSVLLVCQTATLGSALTTATLGVAGTCEGTPAGDGGVGRIAVHHSGAVTGTTSPTFSDVSDPTLIETGGAFLFNLL